jgi:hypothetical protein
MSWYYAEENTQKGPVSDETFASLVQSGVIGPGTLVWRDGMPDWQPYSKVAPAHAPRIPGAPPVPSGDTVVCTECRQVVARAETVSIAGRTVCAACKPRVVQGLVEGTEASGFDPEDFLARIRGRGGYSFSIGAAYSNGFDVVKANFWPCVGVTALMWLIAGAASNIPCAGFVVTGPVFGGILYYFLLQVRGMPATLNEAFAGFRQPRFKELALAGAIIMAITTAVYLVCYLPFMFIVLMASANQSEPPVAIFAVFPFMLAAIGVAMLLTLMWLPSYIIIADKGIGFWAAMELSRKLVFMRFWTWLGFLIVGYLIMVAGMLALCVGMFVAGPVMAAGMACVWQDILRQGEGGAQPTVA